MWVCVYVNENILFFFSWHIKDVEKPSFDRNLRINTNITP